jgi:NAD(P)-dependent dehydrogenase (short-subunit alcohol dehydrogenase family)
MSDQTPRVLVITGASQGIGASLVPAYRKLGYAVLGTSRTIRPPSDDPMIATVQGDIATADTAERVTRHAIDRFGRIDTLINNAGVFVAKRRHGHPRERRLAGRDQDTYARTGDVCRPGHAAPDATHG